MTKNRLKILLVERADSDSTVYNLLAEIKEFDLERVSNHKAVLQAIGHKEHNVYIIDDELDKQDGLAVLREAIAHPRPV